MVITDFTDFRVLIIFIILYLALNITGYVKKNAWFSMFSVLLNTAFLVLHFETKDMQAKEVFNYNVLTDLFFFTVNIPALLIIDEIESRRTIIKSVFENKYKK